MSTCPSQTVWRTSRPVAAYTRYTRTEVFLALCLRIIVAITNDERGNKPDREKLWDGFYDTLSDIESQDRDEIRATEVECHADT